VRSRTCVKLRHGSETLPAFRKTIIAYSEKEFKKPRGLVEADEPYFWWKAERQPRAWRVQQASRFWNSREKRTRLRETIVDNVSAETLFERVKKKTRKGNRVLHRRLQVLQGLEAIRQKHNRVKHSKTLGKGHNHINGIEGFWSFAKERFHKYHGINRGNYPPHVKEMEFSFNHRNEALYPITINSSFTQSCSENSLSTKVLGALRLGLLLLVQYGH
jgi:transposase